MEKLLQYHYNKEFNWTKKGKNRQNNMSLPLQEITEILQLLLYVDNWIVLIIITPSNAYV